MFRSLTNSAGRLMGQTRTRTLKLVGLLLIGLAYEPELHAQTLQPGGYIEHQFYPQKLGGRVVAEDYSKVRLDLNVDLTHWLSATGDVVGVLQSGKTHFNTFDFIPSSVVDSFAAAAMVPKDALRPLFDFKVKNEHYVDNAFVTAYVGQSSARVGRQQLPWGTGYAWNPTDIFNEKNFLDPTYEKKGVDAVKVVVPFSALGNVTAVVGLKDFWNDAPKALRFKDHVSSFDFSVSLMEKHDREIHYLTSTTDNLRRRYLAGDFSGSIGEFGVWFEGAYVATHDRKDNVLALFGADHTTESGWYLMSEYYHNGYGASSRSNYDLDAWMRLISETGDNLGRDYLFLGQSYPLTDLLTGSTYAIVSLTDRSFVAYPYFEYSLSDNAVLTFIGYVPAGRSDSEFGAFGWGAIVRGRYYF